MILIFPAAISTEMMAQFPCDGISEKNGFHILELSMTLACLLGIRHIRITTILKPTA
jgi:hypothetical protein